MDDDNPIGSFLAGEKVQGDLWGVNSDELWTGIRNALKQGTEKVRKTLCPGQVYFQRGADHGARPQYF